MPMKIRIRQADFIADFDKLKHIREAVFVQEQGVPLALEWDEHDAQAYHLLAFADEHTPVATARLLDSGRIGRMAVLREWRQCGIGTALLRQLLDEARTRGLTQVTLSAQVRAIPFYQRLGFVTSGATYEDAGIPHQDMKLWLAASKS